MLFDSNALDSPSSLGLNNNGTSNASSGHVESGLKPRASQSGPDCQDRPPAKRFKTTVPKGARYGRGYQDRASQRRAEQREAEELEEKIRELEEMRKQGQIDEDAFQKQRAQLGVGGDFITTHLVKGLDWELLRKVKAGEKVALDENDMKEEKNTTEEPETEAEPEPEPAPASSSQAEVGKVDGAISDDNADEEFDSLVAAKEREATKPVHKEERTKKGTLAVPPPPSLQNRRLTRDEILKQFKAKRFGQDTSSALGTRFKKIDSKAGTKQQLEQYQEAIRRRAHSPAEEAQRQSVGDIETSESEEQVEDAAVSTGARSSPSSPSDTVEAAPQPAVPPPPPVATRRVDSDSDEEVGDIFEGVGRDYNADLQDEESSSSSEEEGVDGVKTKDGHEPTAFSRTSKSLSPPKHIGEKRNYFATSRKADEAILDHAKPSMSDEKIVSALKAARRKSPPVRETEEEEDKEDEEEEHHILDEGESDEAKARRKKFLEEIRRRDEQDAMDLDLGFGGSRFADEEDDMPYQEEARSGTKRKRGPKRKKGDKNSASAVMGVLEGRKSGK